MCSLFGILDYGNVFRSREINRILTILSRECEVRGTDATGIAYHSDGELKIYKRPQPAHKLRFRVPKNVHTVMGHTRMTTQGSAAHWQNNHPFPGTVQNQKFALSHNGVLCNDKILRREKQLSVTDIETDSYVAVQLLELQETLDFAAIQSMAETVEGSFVFTLLDKEDSLYFVKGDNPLAIYQFSGFYLYASTKEILNKAVHKLRLGSPIQTVSLKEGDILKIDRYGNQSFERFQPHPIFCCQYGVACDWGKNILELNELIHAAKSFGVSEDEVMALLDIGCDMDDIEQLLYNPTLLHEITAELLYSYF